MFTHSQCDPAVDAYNAATDDSVTHNDGLTWVNLSDGDALTMLSEAQRTKRDKLKLIIAIIAGAVAAGFGG